jgi:protein TonB
LCVIAAVCSPALVRAQEKQPASDQDETVYELGPGVSPPRVTKQVSPNYKTARGVRLEGSVTVSLIVSSQGVPREVRVIKGIDKDVDQSAADAVRQWRFAPARKDDKPVAVRVSLEIEFHSM